MNEQFITAVIAMREAQKEDLEKHTRTSMMERVKYEIRVDAWIKNNIADQVQLEMWTAAMKTDESPGAYNVVHDDETKTDSSA